MSGSCRDGDRRPRRDCHRSADQGISATRIVATTIGVVAGLLGLEHGYFETSARQRRPERCADQRHRATVPTRDGVARLRSGFSLVPSFFVIGLLAMISFACDTRTEAETR